MKFNPGELNVICLGEDDLIIAEQLFTILQEVFDKENPAVPDRAYLKRLLDNPGFICFAAICNNELAGGLTAYELPMYYAERSELFIYDIAVKPAYQRMGIGKKLLLAAQAYRKQNGIKQMFVDANEEDKHALDFYRAMGGREERVVQFTYGL